MALLRLRAGFTSAGATLSAGAFFEDTNMDDLYKSHCRELERGEYAEVFRRLRRAFGPKPRLILAKSIVATKRKTIAPSKPVLVVRKPKLSDRELAIFLGDACARGLLSGTDALAAQQAVDGGGKMPPQVRAILLAAYRRTGK